jgi:uncharacterized protein YndB with AHSA1/START domain
MAKMEATVVINRPVEDVFAYIAVVGNWPQWNTSMMEAEQTSEGPVGLGAKFRGVNQFMGQRMEWTSEITTYELNKKLGQKILSGPMSIAQSITLEAVESGTKFTLFGEGETGGVFKLAEPIVNRAMQRQMEGNVANLKDILEAGA